MVLTVKWDEGVFVECGETKLVLDPQRNNRLCSSILITHAHFDHSKGFSFMEPEKVSTNETKVIATPSGQEVGRWKPLPIDGTLGVDDIEVRSHNAGHVLGSALYELTTPDGNVVYTGDIQFKDSFTMKGAEPVSCDILIIESTFGSPTFIFPEREAVARDAVEWAAKTVESGRVPAFKADSLGNAQEIVRAFNMFSKLPVVVHWRVAQINEVYRRCGKPLEFLDARSEEASEVVSSGECVLVAPKNLNLASRPELSPALVSGWALWARENEAAFALSDHADFGQLIEFVRACKPRVVFTCYGGRFNAIFANHVEKRLGIEARPLDLIPTKFVPKPENSRVESCMREVLRALSMPGFVYSKKWITEEMSTLGFSDRETLEAIDRLTRRGRLRVSSGLLQSG